MLQAVICMIIKKNPTGKNYPVPSEEHGGDRIPKKRKSPYIQDNPMLPLHKMSLQLNCVFSPEYVEWVIN